MNTTERVVMVTGPGKGIGRVVAQQYAAGGFQVVLADIDSRGGTETVQSIQREGYRRDKSKHVYDL
ncbi:MAG: SDR family NAD(P)-dependent oxidoreductase [Bacillota bacterium]|nr:SDR family NAD(P)-dependent oxidoreductase [Bacillota bacterium]MDW7684549.1 SDR family NAD(P)-dependent oxidoreductase [Bacillota bacterium]